MNREDIIKEFGLTSELEIMKANVRLAMALGILKDLEAGNVIERDSIEILRQGALRLLDNNDLTGLQRTHWQRYYFDPKPKVQ